MLDLNYLRENLETARKRLADKGFALDVEMFQRLDSERKSVIHEVERLRQLRNTASEEIAQLVRQKVDVPDKRNEMKVVSQQIKEMIQRVIGVTDRQYVKLVRVGHSLIMTAGKLGRIPRPRLLFL